MSSNKNRIDTITLEIVDYIPSYYISRNTLSTNSETARDADDEYILDINCKILELPKPLIKKHLGKNFELSLISAVQFFQKSNLYSEDQPTFFGTVRFWGNQRSGLAYLPAERLWIIEQQIQSSEFKFIEISINYLRRGQGIIEGLYFTKTLDPQF